MSVKCLKCGEAFEPQLDKCPKCGSGDRLVTVEDSCHASDMIGVKEKAKGYHRFKRSSKSGEKVGKNGKIARETRIIDKKTRRYYHRIEVQNEKGEWVTTHEEDEPLEEHGQNQQKKKS
jgi:predicted  nucleic acid-binding Zn-ribbon protein